VTRQVRWRCREGGGCSGSLAITHQSNFCGRRDLVAEKLSVLELKQGRNHVRGVRKIEVKGVRVERNQGEVGAHRKRHRRLAESAGFRACL
jgi:hypothetical protein